MTTSASIHRSARDPNGASCGSRTSGQPNLRTLLNRSGKLRAFLWLFRSLPDIQGTKRPGHEPTIDRRIYYFRSFAANDGNGDNISPVNPTPERSRTLRSHRRPVGGITMRARSVAIVPLLAACACHDAGIQPYDAAPGGDGGGDGGSCGVGSPLFTNAAQYSNLVVQNGTAYMDVPMFGVFFLLRDGRLHAAEHARHRTHE